MRHFESWLALIRRCQIAPARALAKTFTSNEAEQVWLAVLHQNFTRPRTALCAYMELLLFPYVNEPMLDMLLATALCDPLPSSDPQPADVLAVAVLTHPCATEKTAALLLALNGKQSAVAAVDEAGWFTAAARRRVPDVPLAGPLWQWKLAQLSAEHPSVEQREAQNEFALSLATAMAGDTRTTRRAAQALVPTWQGTPAELAATARGIVA